MPSGIYKHQKHSVETKEKMSDIKIGNKNALGSKRDLNFKDKVSERMKGNKYAFGCKRNSVFKNNLRKIKRGKNCNFWRGGIANLSKKIRRLPEYSLWRNKIFERDNYICQECGKSKCILHPHHKKSFSDILKECKINSVDEAISCKDLWNVSNGITLCKECHKLTDNYGNKKYGKQRN